MSHDDAEWLENELAYWENALVAAREVGAIAYTAGRLASLVAVKVNFEKES